jgi:uncharacterized protein (TIGR00730 family)
MLKALKLFAQGINSGYQLAKGIVHLSRIHQPVVTIYGGSRVLEDDTIFAQAYRLGNLLGKHDIAVLTGGGPGVMSAANQGAADAKSGKSLHKWSVGIGVRGVDEDFQRVGVSYFNVTYFHVRKVLLMYYSSAFVFFPGGIGSADEFFHLLNSFKHHRVKKVPVILYNSSYWNSLVSWYERAVSYDFIGAEYKDFFTVSDSIDEIMTILREKPLECQ